MGVNNYLFAEGRVHPYTEEFLRENISLIFIGRVVEVEVFGDGERIVPKKAEVLETSKGDIETGAVIDVIPKKPERYVYFDEEFDQAAIGKIGIFYVGGTEYGLSKNLLVKYKEVPAEQKQPESNQEN